MSRPGLLVIDVQIGLVTGAFREKETVTAINATIDRVDGAGGVVYFIQHCHASYQPMMKGSPGWALHPDLQIHRNALYLEKTASDAFFETDLNEQLQRHGVDTLYVTGLQTEYCVDTTCRAALSHGFNVILVSDAHTTGDAHMPAPQIIAHHNAVLANLAHPHVSIKVADSQSLANLLKSESASSHAAKI